MTRKYATINYDEDAKCYLCGKYYINDKIYINFPTVREVMFDIGEKKYWSIIYSLVATSSDLIAQLDDKGLDWEKVPDFDIFIMNFILLGEEYLSIVLPTIKPSKFILKENPDNQEIILYDEEDGITIDRNIYECIADYIRFAHGIEKNVVRAANAYTHRDLIEDAHEQIRLNKLKSKSHKSQMKAYISYVINSLGYKIDDVLDMKINYFFDCVKRLNAIETAKTMPFMMYYGMIDGSKRENKNSLDPTRSL